MVWITLWSYESQEVNKYMRNDLFSSCVVFCFFFLSMAAAIMPTHHGLLQLYKPIPKTGFMSYNSQAQFGFLISTAMKASPLPRYPSI